MNKQFEYPNIQEKIDQIAYEKEVVGRIAMKNFSILNASRIEKLEEHIDEMENEILLFYKDN